MTLYYYLCVKVFLISRFEFYNFSENGKIPCRYQLRRVITTENIDNYLELRRNNLFN